jgi:hypothetical protein
MKSLEIIGFTKDYRTNTNVMYAQILVNEYFDLIGENYNKFQFQRKKEAHKGYKRLKEDLKEGALIPGITLAIEPSIAERLVSIIEKDDKKGLIAKIEDIKDNIYILDGLQRTHKIKELLDSKVEFKKNQKLLLEIWVEPNISHLVYRLIVLNSGQKPMSMRHQIELLFTTMRVTLGNKISGLEIIVENQESSRKKAKQFAFDRLVTAYYSFLMKTPEVDKASIVSEKLLEEKIMDESEAYLSDSFNSFTNYLKKYTELDEQLFRVYNNTGLNTFRNWFADANVINSFFAAIGRLVENRSDRIDEGIDNLLKLLSTASNGEDVLNLEKYKEIKSEVADPSIYNVGYATRLLLFGSFTEYLRDEGETSLLDCWVEKSIDIKNSKKK